jgi:hypothetical protein
MTTLPFPLRSDASAFDPETISILNDAFENAWQSLNSGGSNVHLGGHEQQTSEILADCETQPSPTLPKQISEKDAIETILHNSQLKSHSEQFETEYYLAPVQASNLRRQRSVA